MKNCSSSITRFSTVLGSKSVRPTPLPDHYLSKKNVLILIQLSLFFFHLCDLAQGEISDESVWQRIETKHTIIHYQSLEDLKRFNTKVKFGPDQWGLNRLFSPPSSDNLADRITAKVDNLFERVQEILDMRKKMKKVTINIYHNKGQLSDVFTEIYKTSCRIRGWYAYEYHTVYLNVDDVHEGMLAHEIAHAVIDHYLLVRPPAASAEILARYVDAHLHK